MTIQNRELNRRLSLIQRCAEMAPEGTYTEAKSAAAAVDEAIESVRDILRSHGFKVNGTDACHDLGAAIYGYLLTGNQEAYGLMTGEGFGEHIDGRNGERIMAQTIASRGFFRKRGLVKGA